MPRARRRRLKRQRKKWGVQPKTWTATKGVKLSLKEIAERAWKKRMVTNARNGVSPPLSHLEILALAAAAKDPAERRRYRKMLERKE